MGEICPKTKSYPPLINQKLIPPSSHNDNIKANLPLLLKNVYLIDSLVSILLVGFLPSVQASPQMTLRQLSFSLNNIIVLLLQLLIEVLINPSANKVALF